jgi:rhamnosyltransferase subunit B
VTSSKKIVFTTWGSFGDLHPFLALALEMKARGHGCAIATSEIYRQKVEAAGLRFYPVRPDLPAPETDEAARMIRQLLDARNGPRLLFREVLMPEFRGTYEDTLAAVTSDGGADILVSHQVPLAAPIVAEETGVKWISSVLLPIAFCSAYDPPTPPQAPWLREVAAMHPWLASGMFEIGKWTMTSWVRPVEELRRELGLPEGKHPIFEGQHSPRRVLGLFSKVLSEVQPDFPPQTVITGFPFYEEGEGLPAGLEEFLNAGDPPIVFTLGSSLVWVDEEFFRVSIEVARRLGQRALLLVGDMQNIPAEGLPDGIAAFEYAPHSLVMPRASVVVHQCGIGTTGQALRSGRPMLCVPHGQDQPDNARRCVKLGVGRRITPAEYKVDRVVQELTFILRDGSYSDAAAGVASIVQNEDGTGIACDAIEGQIES